MPWTPLAPLPKGGKAMCSATITQNKAGLKLVLFLADTLAEQLGDPDCAAVEAGDGEHAGMLRLTFPTNGPFGVKGFLRGGLRISLPVFEALPQRPRTNAPCSVISSSKDEIVLGLPLETWQVEPDGLRPSPAPPASPAAHKPPGGTKLDVVEYLKSKGEKVERLAGGRFQRDGEVVGLSALLLVVNSYRRRADLDPLALSAAF